MNHDFSEKQPNWPWLLLLIVLSLGMGGFFLFLLNRDISLPASWGVADGARNSFGDLLSAFQLSFVIPVVACVFGVLIIRKQPHHRIGWMLIAVGIVNSLMILVSEWTIRGKLSDDQGLPGADFAAWVNNWIWLILMSLVILMIALFPSGRFLSNRWRTILLLSLSFFLVPGIIATAIETPMSSTFQIPNPYFRGYPQLYYFLFNIAIASMAVTTIVALTSTVVRYRRGQGIEHRQIKWLLVGVALFAVLIITGLSLVISSQALQAGFGGEIASVRAWVGANLINFSPLAVLIGIGIAMVRHQLYDIDILIRRTTSYAVLTGLLGIIYFLSVVVLQLLLAPLTGESTAAVILSTLLIASLFLPVRRRVQELIDRRFFRRKYDAQRTLERFAATVRDETDLDELAAELLSVIHETMQPEHVSIWLRAEMDDRRRTLNDG